MTPEDSPPVTETIRPPRTRSRLLAACLLLLLVAACLLLIGIRLRTSPPPLPKTPEPWQPAITQLQNATQQNTTALETLRQQQDDTANTVRKLQQDTATLSPTLTSTYADLSALDDQLDQLPSLAHSSRVEITAPPENSLTPWQRALALLKQVWHQLVTVRHGKNGQEILTPAANQLILLRLQGEISIAKWALLHQTPGIYHMALANTRHGLEQYFPAETTRPLLDRLTELDHALPTADTTDTH